MTETPEQVEVRKWLHDWVPALGTSLIMRTDELFRHGRFTAAQELLVDAICAKLRARDAEQEGVVAKLTELVERRYRKTKDGVYVGVGDSVWLSGHWLVRDGLTISSCVRQNGNWEDIPVSECYSTREAAQAALAAGEGGGREQ